MTRNHRSTQLRRILAVALCLSVVVLFTALLVHHHGVGATSDHDAHCQVCALGHTAASTTIILALTIAMQTLLLLRSCAPTRGSPRMVARPVTRPPPACL